MRKNLLFILLIIRAITGNAYSQQKNIQKFYKIIVAVIAIFALNVSIMAQEMTYFQYSGNPTWAADIDGDNIVGYTYISSPMAVYGYITADDGSSFTTLTYPGENYTYPQGIDGTSIVGYYKDGSAVSHGFMLHGSNWVTLDHPSGNETEIHGVSGDNYVGYYKDDENHYHGCLYNPNEGGWSTIDRPGQLNTKFTGVHGDYIVGNSGDNYSNVNTGFLYNMSTTTWTSIDYGIDGDPNSPQMDWYESTNIEGVDATYILGYYETSGSYKVNFLYEISSGDFSLLAYEQTGGKQATGIDGGNNFVGYSEGGETQAYHLVVIDPPTVTTQEVSAINATTATGNGNITSLGDANVTQHGVCWNTSGTPTTDDNKTTEGTASSTGAFTSSITGLTEDQTYFVRAYATNSGGTSYGSQVSFTAVASVTETWTIELSDSYGDGWNGGSINVLVDGTIVLEDLTINDGNGPESHEFSVSCDDIITTQYFAGDYSYENEYQIKDSNGQVVVESGQYNSTPGNISYTYVCPETPGTVTTQSATNVSYTTATGNGNITSIGTTSITAHGVCWNTSGNPTTGDSSTDEGSTSSTGTFTSDITGLSPGTTYYAKAYITDETGTIYGDQVSFTTSYLVTTQAVSDITGTTATGNGNIQTVASPITAHGICWSTSGNPTTANSHTDEGSASSTGAFTSDITNLTSSTTYYVRAYITNGNGTFYGNQISFQTSFVSIFNGSGTSGDPYQITNLTDLKDFSENSEYWDKYFIQTADIDASASSGWNGGEGLSAIAFSGSYNGQNHTISNLYIDKEVYTRAFFTTANGASISNLGLVDVNFSCWGDVGAFIGSSNGTTSITSCFCSGSVTGSYTNAGGMVGYVGGGTLTINNCYSRVTSYGEGYSGGLIGRAQATIVITDSYNSGSVQGPGTNGGLFAYNYYSWGDYNTITNCFWDTETSGQSTTFDDGTGLTTTEMKTQSTFTNAGWDFTDTWQMDNYTNSGYPFLKWQGGTYAWTGSTDSDWNTSSNWEGNEVPSTLIDNVLIPNKSNDPIVANGGTASCKNLTINSGATLTINSGGSLITAGTITNNGNIDVKQTLTEDASWHFISMPNDNTKAGDLFNQMYLQQWIEGDGTEAGWQDVTDPETTLTPAKGYSLWMDDGAKMDFTYSGTPSTGDQSIAITANGIGTNKWMNFVGNPYPSYLDWGEISGYGTKYTWNGTAYDTRTEAGAGEGSQYVAPMEGFFIYKDAGVADNFNLSNTMRAHQPPGKKEGNKSLNNGLVLAASNGNYDDAFWLVFDNEASDSFELEHDAWKLLSSTQGLSQLWSVSPDGKLAVDVRPETQCIQLGFANDQIGIYSISISEIADIQEAYLEDTKTGKFHNLQSGDYEFTWNPDMDNEDRFKLHFKAVGINENTAVESNVIIYSADRQIFVKGAESGMVTIADMMGRILHQQEISGQETIIPVNYKTGVYIVTVRNGREVKTEKVFIR